MRARTVSNKVAWFDVGGALRMLRSSGRQLGRVASLFWIFFAGKNACPPVNTREKHLTAPYVVDSVSVTQAMIGHACSTTLKSWYVFLSCPFLAVCIFAVLLSLHMAIDESLSILCGDLASDCCMLLHYRINKSTKCSFYRLLTASFGQIDRNAILASACLGLTKSPGSEDKIYRLNKYDGIVPRSIYRMDLSICSYARELSLRVNE